MGLLIVYHELFHELGYPPLKDRVEPAASRWSTSSRITAVVDVLPG